MKSITEYAYLLKVIADETRLKIIEMLSKENLCACHILEEFDITQPTLSYHMKMLVDANLVTSEKEGTWIRYSLNKDVMKDLEHLFLNFYKTETTERSLGNC